MMMNKALVIIFMLFANLLFANNNASYIIKIKPNVNQKDLSEKIQSKNIYIKQFLPEGLINFYDKKEKTMSDAQKSALIELSRYFIVEILSEDVSIIENLRNSEEIESIELNYIYRIEETETFPNDLLLSKQWSLINIQATEAWEKATGKGIIIGIIDTGIDYYHPDLVNQLWINEKEDLNKNGRFEPWSSDVEINGVYGDLNGIDDDGNGFLDDVIGFDFVDQTIMNIGDTKDIDPKVEDENGHGTSVAGVIAAEGNNNLGIIGVAHDSKIITMRAFDFSGNAESDDIASAIVYATLQGAKVLNFSFGEVYSSSIVYDAIKFAYSHGVTMTASSGNNNWTLRHYPSDYDEVISVGGSTSENKRWGLSNYGNRLDIIAPSSDIMTTVRDSSYSLKAGTSFSAPHVAAAAALLLETDSTLVPTEVSGILKASALDFGERGWDIEFGSGILNLKNAVNTIGKTLIEITTPSNESFIDRDNKDLVIIGSVITPLFESFELYFAEGEKPKFWQKISDEKNVQILNDTLGFIQRAILRDTTYTIKLRVNLKNDNSIEKRFYVNTLSSNTSLKISGLKTINAYFNDRLIPIVFVTTNYPAFCRVKYRPKGSNEEFKIVSEFQKFTNFHTVTIEDLNLENVLMEAICEAELPNGIKIESQFEFASPLQFVTQNSFVQKDYGFPLSYLLNSVKDLYGDGNPCVVVNDIASGGWGNTKVYQFKNGSFGTKENFNESWIPIGIGDSNGDDIDELLVTGSAQSILFQANQKGESIFGKKLFSSSIDQKLWAADMIDLNDDGRDELVTYSDSGFYFLTFENNKYKILDSAKPNAIMDTYPGFASGDFDNDGKIEICFGTRDGEFFIYEFSDGKFNLEYNDSSTISSSEQYIKSADIDGDKIPEIVIGNFGSMIPFGKEDASTPVWTFRIFKSETTNKYIILDTIHINGVRGGVNYKNGMTAGDIDKDSIDEIIVSAFPNLYVFKWDGLEFRPIWNYPFTFSNSAIIYDFDGNGINEIGISTFGGTRFFEVDIEQKPGIPLGFNGWSVDTNKAYFEWLAVPNAKEYELINMIRTETGYSGYTAGITTETNITIDTLRNKTNFEFVVRAINNELPEQYSNISNFIDIYTHEPVEPLTAIPLDDYRIYVGFSGEISDKYLNAGDFILTKDDVKFATASTALIANDTATVLTLISPMEMGEYKLDIKSFRDKFNSPTINKILNFDYILEEPESKMYLKQISVTDKTTLYLTFSEEIDDNTCLNRVNYTLNPYGEIIGVEPDEENLQSVFIYLDKNKPLLATGKNYTLTVTNTESEFGKPITTGAGNTMGFVFYSDDVNDSYIYPNPVKYSENQELMFANLPSKAEVIIYNLEMQELNRVYEYDGNGGTEWDGRDKNGESLGSGVYLFKVIRQNADGSTSESELKKFVVVSR